MESLNMNTLASSLPTSSNLANAEKDLLNNFKAAAMSITTLYRSSRQTSKRAFNAGYAKACQDLLVFIQQGVSVSGAGVGEGGDGMTIGRVMDWVEARLEAIKVRDEEELEEERDTKSKATATAPTPQQQAANVNKPTAPPNVGAEKEIRSAQRTSTPPSPPTPATTMVAPPPPPTPTVIPILPPPTNPRLRAKQRAIKEAAQQQQQQQPAVNDRDQYRLFSTSPTLNVQDENALSLNAMQIPMFAEVLPPGGILPSVSIPVVGSKRRRDTMLSDSILLDGNSGGPLSAMNIGGSLVGGTGSGGGTTVSTNGIPSSTARRRTRASRGGNASVMGSNGLLANGSTGDAMDVEDDGRERKRATRR